VLELTIFVTRRASKNHRIHTL